MEALIIPFLEALVHVARMSREAFAAKLEEMAQDIRDGKLIPEEAFQRAKATHEATLSARDKLPD